MASARDSRGFDDFDRVHKLAIERTIVRTSKIYSGASALLAEYHKRARRYRDAEMERSAYWMRIAVYTMAGHIADAEKLLREQRIRYPDARSNLAIAQHLMHQSRFREALSVLRRKEPTLKATDAEISAFYEVLWRRGICQMWLQRHKAAAATMGHLVRFTAQNIDRIRYFFDVHFVGSLVKERIALRECRRYLEMLAKRKQVIHDAKRTRVLLRQVDTMLMR
jgi:hypothetical protein